MGDVSEQAAQRLVTALGEPFLKYVLVLPEDVPALESIPKMTNPEPAIFLLTAINQAPSSGSNELDVTLFASGGFAHYQPGLGGSLAHHIRRLCGGEIGDIPAGEDPVVQALRKVTHDIWPILLLRPPTKGPRAFWMSAITGIISPPGALDAAKAFMADAKLNLLFPDAESIEDVTAMGKEVLSIQGEWIMSGGQGGTRQLISVLDAIIFNAAVVAQLDGSPLTHASIMTSLEESVATFRTLASRRAVEVPAIIGFSGVRMDDERKLSFGDGELRAMLPIEHSLLLSESDRVTSVYATRFSVQILSISKHDPGDPDRFFKEFQRYAPRIQEAHRTLQRRVDRVRLALLLASPTKDQLLATSQVSLFIGDPTQPGGSSSWETDPRGPASYEVAEEVGNEAVRWHGLIQAKHPESLNIAMKRLLSAVSQRWDAIDAFIDAVVVWENAFGTQQETTFRVTASIAKLLEPGSANDRAKLQTELKKLYSARSLLVHGAKEPKPEDAWAQRERAIEIAVELLRKLYDERPDLLDLPSDARGAQLLLEG